MDASPPHPPAFRFGAPGAEAAGAATRATTSPEASLSGIRWFPALCGGLVCMATLWNTVEINHSTVNHEDSMTLEWPVMVKLVLASVCSLVGLAGVLLSRQVRGMLWGIPGIALLAMALVFVGTSIFAYEEVVTVSRMTAVMNLGYLCFVPTALSVLGLRRMAMACLIGLVLNLIANWILYLGLPSVGIFAEELSDSTFVLRMGGLGHPNAVARAGVLAGLLSLAALRGDQFSSTGRLILMAIFMLAIATTVAAFSRTAYVAAIAAGVFLCLDKLVSRAGITLLLAGVTLLLGGVIAGELLSGGKLAGDSLVSAMTKTGDVEELTSATGRTLIWAESLRLIGQRPLVGWGLNSAPQLLTDFSMHTHNVILHATFSGGILAGLLMVACLMWNLGVGMFSAEPLVRAISVYILVSGTFEDTVLDTFASPSTLLWFLALMYPAYVGLSRGTGASKATPDRSITASDYTEA